MATARRFGDSPIKDFVDDSHAVLNDRSRLRVIDPGGDDGDWSSFSAITPETDYWIVTVVVGTGGDTTLFDAARGTELAIFSVPVDGSADPVKVADIVPGERLLFWL